MNLGKLDIYKYLPENLSSAEKRVAVVLLITEVLLIIATTITGAILIFGLLNSPKQTPIVAPQKLIQFTPTIQPTATNAPTTTPSNTPLSDIWTIYQIYENVTLSDGTITDVATLVNQSDQYTQIKARCIDPGWPSPSIGQTYRQDSDGTLLPEPNNKTNNLQRFVIFNEQLPK